MLFSEKIKQLREEKRLLQRQLAAVLEIDTHLYSKIERGDCRSKREQVPIVAVRYRPVRTAYALARRPGYRSDRKGQGNIRYGYRYCKANTKSLI